MAETTTSLVFPGDFLIKVFGLVTDTVETATLQIIRQHSPKLLEDAIKQRNT
jgi:putative lipoic acid-binding regulatory protein